MTIERLEPRLGAGPHMSRIVVHGDTIYLAGQVAQDRSVGVREQTEQILANIDRQLATVGSSHSKVLSAVIWLTDMSKFEELNEAWNAWVDPGNLPVRACVNAQLAHPDPKVEIMVIAAK